MFGYVIPDKPNLFIKDYYAFKAYYCGLCKATGKRAGTLLRLTTNYDSTILNILVHNLVNKEVEVTPQRCILHPFSKKAMMVVDDVTLSVADANIILLYYKLSDNIIDKDGKFKSKTARKFMKRTYKKTCRRHKELDKIVSDGYEALREKEKENCASIDAVSDCFASLLKNVGAYLCKKSSYDIDTVFYCLGKWIYLIDALDDLDSDFEKGRYNPWIASFGEFTNAKEFTNKYKTDIERIIYSTVDLLVECYDKLDMPIQEGVLTNTFYYGLKAQTERILRRETKCHKTRL